MTKKKKNTGRRRRRKSRIPKRFFIPAFLLTILAGVWFGGENLEQISISQEGMALLEEAENLVQNARDLTGELAEKFFPEASLRKGDFQAEQAEGTLTVWFLDVGQGSAALVETAGHFMLIDGGDRSTSSKVVSILEEQGVKGLDYIVLSHYDSDHLAGVIGALNRFPVSKVLSPDYETPTELFVSYETVISEKGIHEVHPEPGTVYPFGEGSFTLVGPRYYGHGDGNDDSLCIRLEFAGKSILFCGDAGEDAEEEMERGNLKLKSDVYVVNHHGSASSTSQDFFDRVDPDYGVISCGANNSYGHPSARVMNLLKKNQVEIFRTDLQGTIQAVVQDGELTWNVPSCMDFSSRSTG